MPSQLADMTDRPDIVLDVERLTKNCNGNRHIVTQLLCHLCRVSGPQWIAALKKGIQDGDRERLEDICHGMKGACATVFAWRFSNLAFELECLSREGDTATLANRLGELQQRIMEIENWLHENQKGPTGS